MSSTQLRLIATLLAAIMVGACASERNAEQIVWADMQRWVLEKREGPVDRHVLNRRVYYFVRSPCCDMYNHLYDAQGDYVCAPNGGFTGQGDGKCPQLRATLNRSKGEQVPNPFYKP